MRCFGGLGCRVGSLLLGLSGILLLLLFLGCSFGSLLLVGLRGYDSTMIVFGQLGCFSWNLVRYGAGTKKNARGEYAQGSSLRVGHSQKSWLDN